MLVIASALCALPVRRRLLHVYIFFFCLKPQLVWRKVSSVHKPTEQRFTHKGLNDVGSLDASPSASSTSCFISVAPRVERHDVGGGEIFRCTFDKTHAHGSKSKCLIFAFISSRLDSLNLSNKKKKLFHQALNK